MEETTNRLQSAANNIFPVMFSLTVDNQNKHPDDKIPILDLKVWVDGDNQIKHEFYAKPMAYKGIVWTSSGLSKNIKKNIIMNEGLRRLSNCSPSASWESKSNYLTECYSYLQQGGHSEPFRIFAVAYGCFRAKCLLRMFTDFEKCFLKNLIFFPYF